MRRFTEVFRVHAIFERVCKGNVKCFIGMEQERKTETRGQFVKDRKPGSRKHNCEIAQDGHYLP